jgi:hypothetical protein
MHQYTSIDFCLDEIGKIDWVCHFTGLKELTIANNSVTEIEVRTAPSCKLLFHFGGIFDAKQQIRKSYDNLLSIGY